MSGLQLRAEVVTLEDAARPLVEGHQADLRNKTLVTLNILEADPHTLSLTSSGRALISSWMTTSRAGLFSPSLAVNMDSLSLYTTSLCGTAFSAIFQIKINSILNHIR